MAWSDTYLAAIGDEEALIGHCGLNSNTKGSVYASFRFPISASDVVEWLERKVLGTSERERRTENCSPYKDGAEELSLDNCLSATSVCHSASDLDGSRSVRSLLPLGCSAMVFKSRVSILETIMGTCDLL